MNSFEFDNSKIGTFVKLEARSGVQYEQSFDGRFEYAI